MNTLDKMLSRIDELRSYAAELLSELIKRPSINPSYGGEGEYDKAEFILEIIREWGFDDIKIINVPDKRARGGVRPNIIAFIRGEADDRFWILSHLDVVPPGDLSAWTVTKPFEPRIIDDKIYGRGSEDNGQGIVSSLIAARVLLESGARPRRTIALAFVSDEEAGSEYGLKYIVRNHRDLFSSRDVALVPDAGSSNGDFIEIAEKGIAWIKLRIRGIQTHGSTPHKGLNPHRVASELILEIDEMIRERYGAFDELFDPPYTTCEPTMTRNSSGSPNIIPGDHEIVLDCRVLPTYSIDSLLRDVAEVFNKLRKKYSKKLNDTEYPILEIEILNREDPAPTVPRDSIIVKVLIEALRKIRGIEPRIGGIGGGTFAAILRRIGVPAVVWATIDETAHTPNEYSRLSNIVNDAKIMLYLMLNT